MKKKDCTYSFTLVNKKKSFVLSLLGEFEFTEYQHVRRISIKEQQENEQKTKQKTSKQKTQTKLQQRQ